MSARSYLSIGDVLTLLRQEFPDVTISKIRFLESQGLVNPERTPSGYRKFYEHDVERLRWVLRQQREHFLPLKVIKDRLEEESGPAVVTAKGSRRATAPAAGSVAEPAVAAAVATPSASTHDVAVVPEEVPVPEPVLVGHRASSTSAESTAESSSGPEPATAPPPERAHRASLSTQHAHAAEVLGGGSGNGATGSGPTHATARASSTPSRPTPEPSTPDAPAATPAAPATRSSTRSSRAAAPVPAVEPAPAAVASAVGMSGASLSLDELCAASGLRAEYVAELQEYGLVRATLVGGAEYFDEEALTVANVAGKLAAYGIGARHLRLYKNAAEREAGFIEQVVIPMVRQRNPEARARASQTADELAGLGQQLRGSLLRTALRDLLNG